MVSSVALLGRAQLSLDTADPGRRPLQLDLTAYRALTDLNTWQWDIEQYETTLLDTEDKLSLFRSD